MSASVARCSDPVSAPGRSTSAMPGCSSVACGSVRLGTNWSSSVPRSASATAYSRGSRRRRRCRSRRRTSRPPRPPAGWPWAGRRAARRGRCRPGRPARRCARRERAGCSPVLSSCLRDERGRRDRLPAQVRPRRGDDGPGRQRAARRAAGRSSLRGQPGELAGVDPQLRPHAQRLARLGEDARRRGDVVEHALRRVGGLAAAAAPAPPGSRASRRCARRPDSSSSGSRRDAALRPVRRCSITPRRRAAATPARSRSVYRSRSRSRCCGPRRSAGRPGATGRRRRGGDLRHRVAGQVHGQHPEAVRRAVPQPRQRPRLDPRRPCGAPSIGSSGGVSTTASVGAVRAGRLDVHDGQPGPGRGQAPAVPAGDDLVQVVADRRVAGRPVQRRQLQEPDVGRVGEDAARRRAPRVTVTRRRCRLCQSLVTSSHTSTRMPRTRSSSSSSRVPSSAASASASWTRRAQLGGPFPAGDREAGRAQRAGRRRRRVAVRLAGVLPGEVARVLVELEPGGVRVDVEHHPVVVAERQRAAHPRVAGPGGEHARRRRRPRSCAAGAPAGRRRAR